jgi:hypothetical protein
MTRNYTYKPRKGLASNPFMRGNDFLKKLGEAQTLSDKRSHVVEANPLFYCLGETLDPRNPYERNNDGQD